MADFVLAPVARSDLHEIWDYYAHEVGNVDFADRIRDELFTAFDKLARTPGIGHFRRDLALEPLRFWQVRQYLIIHRDEKRQIEIVCVLHVKRDVQALLE
jgi:antitoxin ParD1/3/4/toxin ParE1/3/4